MASISAATRWKDINFDSKPWPQQWRHSLSRTERGETGTQWVKPFSFAIIQGTQPVPSEWYRQKREEGGRPNRIWHVCGRGGPIGVYYGIRFGGFLMYLPKFCNNKWFGKKFWKRFSHGLPILQESSILVSLLTWISPTSNVQNPFFPQISPIPKQTIYSVLHIKHHNLSELIIIISFPIHGAHGTVPKICWCPWTQWITA